MIIKGSRRPVLASTACDVVRRISPRIQSRASNYDALGSFPVDDFADLKEAELLGLMVPQRLGGSGASFADYVNVAMELAQASGATALLFNMHSSIIGALSLASDDMAKMLGANELYFQARDEILSNAADGSFYAVAMSERGVGARLSLMQTSYKSVDGGYHIKGSKTFVSGAGFADGYLIAAKSEDAQSADISYFLVPASHGLVVEETWDSLGMRATGSHDLHIDVMVDEAALIGGVQGLAISLAQSMPQWLVASYSAVYVGVAQAAINAAVDHVNKSGTAHLSAVRSNIGKSDAAVAAARLAVIEAAHRVDKSAGEQETNRWIYRAKLLAGETAMSVAALMLEVAGTSATRKGHPLERLYRDARCGALQPATSSVCADWLGLSALGLSPELQGETPRW